MSITLVITTRNRPKELADAIRSAVDIDNISQIIVVDDGSDKPVHRLPGHKLLYVSHNQCEGVSAARNTGLSLTKTKYIAYLDDDDTLCANAFSSHLAIFNTLSKHDANNTVVVGTVLVKKTGKIIQRRLPPSSRPGEIWGLDEFLLKGKSQSFLTKQAALYPTRLLRAVGRWDVNIRSRVVTDLFIRISQDYPIYGIEVDTYVLNRDDKQRITRDLKLREKSFQYLTTKHRDLLKDKARFNYIHKNHTRKIKEIQRLIG